MRGLVVITFITLIAVGSVATAHTGVPSEPSGLHPIYHGDVLVGGYTSKGYVAFGEGDASPTWRRMPATSGMYVAAYGTPDGRTFTLTTAGLWQVENGGCDYTEAETQFGPMTLVQSAFHPSGNYLGWIGATASNGKPVLYFSDNGGEWSRVLSLPPGLGWRGMVWEPTQAHGLGVFRERDLLRVVSLMEEGTIQALEPLPESLPIDADLLRASPDYQTLYFRSTGDSEFGERLWSCSRSNASCELIYDSPDKLFHALWYQDESTLAWMDELGQRQLLGLDGALLTELDSVGYFGFLPNLGANGWFLKKTPATHAFSILGPSGDESPWLGFADILIEPCPPKPGEEIDTSNPFEESPEDDNEENTPTPDQEVDETDDNASEQDDSGDESSGGCQSASTLAWLPLLITYLGWRRTRGVLYKTG